MGLNPGLPGPLVNTLLIEPMARFFFIITIHNTKQINYDAGKFYIKEMAA